MMSSVILGLFLFSTFLSPLVFADAIENTVITSKRQVVSPGYYSAIEQQVQVILKNKIPLGARAFIHVGLKGSCANQPVEWQMIQDFQLHRECRASACNDFSAQFSVHSDERSNPCSYTALQFVFRIERNHQTDYIKGSDSALGYYEATFNSSPNNTEMPLEVVAVIR